MGTDCFTTAKESAIFVKLSFQYLVAIELQLVHLFIQTLTLFKK